MSFAVPLVYVADVDTREEAIRRANSVASQTHLNIACVGEPVEFPTPDYEDLDSDDPKFVVVVEYRES